MDRPAACLMEACARPSKAALKEALGARNSLSQSEADFLTYLAGFTHYPEAEELLGRFCLEMGAGLPLLFDNRDNTAHVKVFASDLTHEVGLKDILRPARGDLAGRGPEGIWTWRRRTPVGD
jgi:hypothetical protein